MNADDFDKYQGEFHEEIERLRDVIRGAQGPLPAADPQLVFFEHDGEMIVALVTHIERGTGSPLELVRRFRERLEEALRNPPSSAQVS